MASCSSIINRALRKLGRLGAGRDARTQDAEDALDALRGLYRSWIASGAFGRMSDIIVDGDYTAGDNQRIFIPEGVTATITLPPTMQAWPYPNPPQYGEWPYWQGTFEGAETNLHMPKDGSAVVLSDADTGTVQTFIYDGTRKQWQLIDDLTLDSDAPHSEADPEGLAAALAIEVADQFGADIQPSTTLAASRFRSMVTNGFGQPRRLVPGVFY